MVVGDWRDCSTGEREYCYDSRCSGCLRALGVVEAESGLGARAETAVGGPDAGEAASG